MDTTKEKKTVSKKTFEALRKRQLRRKKIAITSFAALAVVLVLVILYCFGVYEKFLEAIGVEPDISVEAVVSEIAYAPRGESIIGSVENCVIVCDENGVTGLDKRGAWKWNVSCPVVNPVMHCYKEFVLLLDHNGKNVWCFDQNGQRWRYDSDKPILNAFASASGDSLVLLRGQQDFETSVTYFNYKNGVLTETFTRKFGTYHMVAGACSPNNASLVLSGVYASGGELTGAAVFMRVRDGDVFSTVVTQGQAYLYTEYLNNDVVFAANTESLRFLKRVGTASAKQDEEKVLWSREGGRTSIADVACVAQTRCVVAYKEDNVQETEGAKSSLIYYNSDGSVHRTIKLEGNAQGVETRGETVAAYTDKLVYMFNEKGNRIGSYAFESAIESVSYIGNRELLVVCQDQMWHVSFEE